MADIHEAKYSEMQKYVPFIQRVIDKLKVNNDQQSDNPRKAQLQKMEMLYDLLTNKQKKIKFETLTKCEGVLIKLQAKIEKQTNISQNEDAILGDIKLKDQTSCMPITSTNRNTIGQDISGPASPPPEVILDDYNDEPVVIPTERRSSPILVKELTKHSADKTQQQHKKESSDQARQKDSQHSAIDDFHSLKKAVFNLGCKAAASSPRHNPNNDKNESHHSKHSNSNRQNSNLTYAETNNSPARGKTLQTVKVVITEPLPIHFKQQHFPQYSKFLPRSSVCHNNLRTLPQANQTKVDSTEAYSPDELWNQYNEKYSNQSSVKTSTTAPVFSRLGAKVTEDVATSPSTSKVTGRYTPIPDVLKSPPLSVSDINNLLIESGSDKILNDISEIGSRRPPKTHQDNQKESSSNSFEFVRKKLAQTAKMNSPNSELRKRLPDSPSISTKQQQERVALKYNPHPRQERLLSVSSTDGSESSFQCKINDPRIKSKLQTSSSVLQSPPTHVPASNVNVLPAINLSDPRLKKLNTQPATPERITVPSTPPTFTSSPNMGFPNHHQSPICYSNRKQPRIARIPNNNNNNNNNMAPIQTTPTRRMSINQPPPQYSPEENWDSDEEPDKNLTSNKNNYERIAESREGNSFVEHNNSNGRGIFNQSRFQLDTTASKEPLIVPTNKSSIDIKSCFTNIAPTKQVQELEKSVNKSKNKLIPNTTFLVPNPPRPESEEDWDSEPEVTNVWQKPQTQQTKTEAPQLPVNISPVIPMHISPQALVSPKHFSSAPPVSPLTHVTQIPYIHRHYPIVGSANHPPTHHRMPIVVPASNRFNSILNDKSERIKYFEAKKQKANEPRTYKEFREAKERAQALEAANKKAAEEAAEARKKSDEAQKEKELSENINVRKEKQVVDTTKKVANDKSEKKSSHHKDSKKLLTGGESTLDKMYRTQNFSTSFPKANTSFKIPKKKTDGKTKDEAANTTNEAPPTEAQTEKVCNEKIVEKIKPKKVETSFDKIKSTIRESINNNKVSNNKNTTKNDIKTKLSSESIITVKKSETNTICDKLEEKVIATPVSKENSTKQKPINDNKVKEKSDNKSPIEEDISSIKQIKKETKVEKKVLNEKSQENLVENNLNTPTEPAAIDDNKVKLRDPRCRVKTTPAETEQHVEDKKETNDENKVNIFADIVITSSENQVVLKPQDNLDKFNKFTQELSPKPQRILRRRNTMVVFDSAPLVDKDKLKKANALLFEDVQEEEKRKRKQAEEDRLNARRNKHLEEMFKKTDDNCTVSTQNIITGKRRTRATINFNETVNAINIFKHKIVKDSPPSGIALTTVPAAAAPPHSVKAARSNFKIKIKNLGFSDTKNNNKNSDDDDDDDDDSDDDVTLQTIAKREAKLKEAKGIKAAKSSSKDSQMKKVENKTDECETEMQSKIKLEKRRAPVSRKSSSNNTIEDEEHQNCAVSSTSTENCVLEEITCSASSVSTKKSFKKETDDNEPSSTGSKSNNSTTTTVEAYEPVLHEIVDQILMPNANRAHIFDVLSQILSEEKLELIKSLIEISSKQNEEQLQINKEDKDGQNATEETNVAKIETVSSKSKKVCKIKQDENEDNEDDEDEDEEDRKPLKLLKTGGGKKITIPKKRRSELDRLNEDIRDMFICNGVITAAGRRMCTIMGKTAKETSNSPPIELENTNNKRKEEVTTKPPIVTRTLRRSVRSCKIIDDNEDNDSIISRTTDDSDENLSNTNGDSIATDITPQRKMPVLKPHTPIKIPDDILSKTTTTTTPHTKESAGKRKSDSKFGTKAKKSKINKDDSKDVVSNAGDEKESETIEVNAVVQEEGDAAEDNNKKDIIIKNTNIHWHNQSKYTTWCMICEKKIHAIQGSLHYKIHHRENYISRMAPVLLQQLKQGKLNKPMFGVKRSQKQPSWFYRCPFCLKYFNTSLPLWLEHFQNHTVEYRYECSKCYYCNSRKTTVARHLKNCEGATILTSPLKLNVPTTINAHVCHLCNFIQLKRKNLERHYIEQHHLEQKTVDLLGYTLKLFDVQDVECVNEKNAIERENEAWKCIEQNEKVIDIDDDETSSTTTTIPKDDASVRLEDSAEDMKKSIEERDQMNNSKIKSSIEQQTKEPVDKKTETEEIKSSPIKAKEITKTTNLVNPQRQDNKKLLEKITNAAAASSEKDNITPKTNYEQAKKITTNYLKTEKLPTNANVKEATTKQEKSVVEKIVVNKNFETKTKRKKKKTPSISDMSENPSNDFELVDQEVTVQDIQDELLVLAAKAAKTEEEEDEKSNENQNTKKIDKNFFELESSSFNDNGTGNKSITELTLSNSGQMPTKVITGNCQTPSTTEQTTISDIISSSIDLIYNRDSGNTNKNTPNNMDVESALDATKINQCAASNVFMPTRDESNYSPTIQILAQSIINIAEQGNDCVKDKPITMAERLSQRFKDLQSENSSCDKSNVIISATPSTNVSSSAGNAFERLINDTLLELTKEKDSATNKPTIINSTPPVEPSVAIIEKPKQNVFEKFFSETVLELEKDNQTAENESQIVMEKPPKTTTTATTKPITVISDDEDWEDIEITETAPTSSTTAGVNIQKTKSKGLFQKFGIFKGNNTKSKKLLTPMVFLPKKKQKEKATTLPHSPVTVATTDITKVNECTSNTANTTTTTTNNNSLSNSNAQLGFKPLVNIMDGLFPDSPCNDPIDLVPELAPLEPLQDLNDISSILDSNLSAVNINAADNHTSIEDALDFISEQQANDKEKSNGGLPFSIVSSQTKNNISHVGFSVQSGDGNAFKFYCLLQNCSFLYSSDSLGLETHFMCEHSEIKWNGYCLLCECQCLPSSGGDVTKEYSISMEIRHMMVKHANKTALDLNTDSTQHSTTSSHENEERPKIKIRRLTGDCLSRATPENIVSGNETVENITTTNNLSAAAPLSMLGALLIADPKPPTKEMPPQPQMPLTEPILLNNNKRGGDNAQQLTFRNVNSDFLITSVTSALAKSTQPPLQISSVTSLNSKAKAAPMPPSAAAPPQTADSDQIQIPKIMDVRTLAPKAGIMWSQQIEKDRHELAESAEESLEVSRILQNAGRPSTHRELSMSANDSPVLVAETVPLTQSKIGDFVVTQTVSAQYNEFSSTALGFNISIAPSTTTTTTAATVDKTNEQLEFDSTASDNTTPVAFGLAATRGDTAIPNPEIPNPSNSSSTASRQYKCMGSGCKFVSRVPVAMSDHLRFHERRNFSNKQDYLVCGFCFYCASDIEDYMKHAGQFHIVNKGNVVGTTPNEADTAANSLTKKIQNILNNSIGSSSQSRYTVPNQTTQVQDTQEVYLKKLRQTIEEIVGPTGLADDKLYRCVVKNCHTQLTESTFLSHIMFHITAIGGNPNNYIFKCPHCTAQYHRPAGIKAHIKNHARNRYFCYLCDETSTNPGQLLKHFSEKHWHTLNMYTKELLHAKLSKDGTGSIIDSSYYVAYTQDLNDEEVRKFGEKLILEWQRKKCGSKTHFKSSEIDLLPLSAIFQRQVNCGECEYKTKVRTNMFRHLLMHKQNPGMANISGVSKVCSVDPVNPVPCLNSSERFFDKMTNLASSSLIPSSSSNGSGSSTNKPAFKLPQAFVEESKRYVCGCSGCNYHTITEDLFRTHLSSAHSTATTYCCKFCKDEICKRGITLDRIMNHTRFHGTTIYRCEDCNYVHHMRYVVERHINEKHSTMKVNIVTHNRSISDTVEGTTTKLLFTGKKFREFSEGGNQTPQMSNASAAASTRSATNTESSGQNPIKTYVNSTKAKGKWLCDVCGHKASTLGQIQGHCLQQHSVKSQYKCAHCNFGSQQLSQILHHIDEKHSGKTREARYIYHKIANNSDEVADTRPLWQRNDPTRVRHIRGILMEDEEESEEYRKSLSLTEDVDEDDSNEVQQQQVNVEENYEDLNGNTYLSGYEFGCYHCSFKTQTFEDLKNQHYEQAHNSQIETAKPFWYRLHRRLCCPECRSFIGNFVELHQHLQTTHKKRFYAADIRMAEYDDTSQRILCGFCSFHGANTDQLYRHHVRLQHCPQDIRIDNDAQIMGILSLGSDVVSYQCTLCADIFSNQVAIVQHVCNQHPGEDSSPFRELTNSLIYRCHSCCFTSTSESELFRHAIDHYSRFKICHFCKQQQRSFVAYMQHCYAEHRNDILKFRTIHPINEIRKFLLQTLIIFSSGLVLNKRNLLNTKYGKTGVIEEVYEDIFKISQEPPIPRISIARLVARKSIESHQKHGNASPQTIQDDVLEAMQQPHPKSISKRRRTVAFSQEDHQTNSRSLLKPKFSIIEGNWQSANIVKRRTTIDNDQQQQKEQQEQKHNNNTLNAPLKTNKISKRRRTVAVDRETLFSSNLMTTSADSLLTEIETSGRGKKRKSSYTHAHTSSPKYVKEIYPLNLDMDPFSFYGQKPENLDLSKIYTKVAIGGIRTPLTVDKFKLLFNIDCRLQLTKCDEDNKLVVYNDYKHIKKACPASHKFKHN